MDYLKRISIRSLLGFVMLFALAFAFCMPARANPEYIAMTRKTEKFYDIPFALLGGICRQESNWNPNAIGAKQEIGLCQLKQETARLVCPKCIGGKYIMQMGQDDPRIAMVKRRLTALQYYTGASDTRFDVALDLAVRSFQFNSKLKVDGEIGGKTWAKLFGRKMTGNSLLDQLYDPETNIDLAGRYLAYLMKTLNTRDYELLAIAYNSGGAGKAVQYAQFIRTHIKEQTDGLVGAPRFN